MATVLVDFDTHMGRDFEVQRPIGVWLTRADGGIDLRYRPEVEDGEDPGNDNYLLTYQSLEEFVDGWRGGTMTPDFAALLEYLSETTYLGRCFRTFSEVPDEMTIDEAYERFVVNEEALPVG